MAECRTGHARPGFSLIEVVLVVVILGVLAAIAAPRLSRGADGAGEAALAADLRLLNEAIHFYAIEHGGKYPGPTANAFAKQLTTYSSRAGATAPAYDGTHCYGPYLVAIPACPIGPNAGNPRVQVDNNSPPADNFTTGVGWSYNPATGEIVVNLGKPATVGSTSVTESVPLGP